MKVYTFARMLIVGVLAGTGLALVSPGTGAPAGPAAAKVVYLAGGLSDESLVTLGAAVAAQPGAVLLLDSKPLNPSLRHFLSAYRADRVIPVGSFPLGKADLEQRLGVHVEPPLPWPTGPPTALWQSVFPKARRVVVCAAEPREVLLSAACLAGAAKAPLWVSHDRHGESTQLRRQLKKWGTREVIFAGEIDGIDLASPRLHVRRLTSTQSIQQAYQHRLAAERPIENAVLANPLDRARGMGSMSVLAPWLAVSKHAALLLTNPAGTNAADLVTEAVRRRPLAHLDTLILAASLPALPMLERSNPMPSDKDPVIELEPLTPAASAKGGNKVLLSDEPISYAIGRLFHDDLAVVPLMLARQQWMAQLANPRRALVASNPGGSLPLLEAFSRNTAQELRNTGYAVTELYDRELTGPRLRKAMVGQDLFLWEGHHNTLVKEWGFTTWDEVLPPTFVFLQSCLALKTEKVQPLLSRGAIGVIGTSTRTYSGSGGAMSLAFFNALIYDGQTLGGSLRQAKNYLLAYAMLKERRLGGHAARTGANLRAAWAFTLWGDPTFRLPRPATPSSALPGVKHEVTGNSIVVELPDKWHHTVTTDKYQVRMAPNARLAGLVRKTASEKALPLVPLVFAEVHLPRARPGQTPRLRTRLPASNWVFFWDARRRTGYLLVAPRSRDRGTLRFGVEWAGQTIAERISVGSR